MKTKIVIGLTGLAGAGKDTVADYLVEQHNFTKLAYADTLRAEVAHAWGIAPELLSNRAQKEIPQVPLEIGRCQDSRFVRYALTQLAEGNEAAWAVECNTPRSPRWIMQRWGDFRRELLGKDYFLNALRQKIEALDSNIVVSDVRFNNEAQQMSQHKAWIWHIQRPNLAAVSAHASENGIDPHWIDCDINNSGSINDLIEHTADKLTRALFGEKAA